MWLASMSFESGGVKVKKSRVGLGGLSTCCLLLSELCG